MTGTRVADRPWAPNAGFVHMPPGGYGRVQQKDGSWKWYCRTPTGDQGNLGAHEVTEHENGTITVSPSILVTTTRAGAEVELWHGYLLAGVWSECS